MIDRVLLFGLTASAVMLFFVLELVRQRRLREEYSLLWLATAVVLLLLSVTRPLLDLLASFVGIAYPPSALFLVAMMFVLFILLHFSMVLSRLTQENKEMAQRVAILNWQLARLNEQSLPTIEQTIEPAEQKPNEAQNAT